MTPRPSLPAQLGLLAAATVALQLGPLYWPGGGLLLALGATLPAALAAGVAPRRCAWFFLTTGFFIGLFSVEEMFIYMTVTGPLGLMLGLTGRRPRWLSVGTAASLLVGGMLLLPRLAGVLPWGGLEAGWPAPVRAGGYALFALPYAWAWHLGYRRLEARLARVLRMRYTGGNEP